MGLRVLLVDDNAALRAVLGLYLADAGYDVLEAGDGETALRVARTETIDLAVLDVVLPDCSGVTLTTPLRHSSRMPILLMSSLAENEVDWRACGANGFMRKPLRPKDFVMRVDALRTSSAA